MSKLLGTKRSEFIPGLVLGIIISFLCLFGHKLAWEIPYDNGYKDGYAQCESIQQGLNDLMTLIFPSTATMRSDQHNDPIDQTNQE